MRQIFVIVAEMTGNICYPDIFLNVPFDIIKDVLEHLPLVFGRYAHIQLPNVLVVDFAQNQGGHVIDGQPVVLGTDSVLQLFHQHNYFFRIQRPALLRDQKPDIIFRQIRKGVGNAILSNYGRHRMGGCKMHPVKAAVRGPEAPPEVGGRLPRRKEQRFTCIYGKILILIGQV